MFSTLVLDEVHLFTAREEIKNCFENFFKDKTSIYIHSTLDLVHIAKLYNNLLFVDPKTVNGELFEKMCQLAVSGKLFFVLLQNEVLTFLDETKLPNSTVIPVPCDEEIFVARRLSFKKHPVQVQQINNVERSILDEIVGCSPFIKQLKQSIFLAAKSDLPIFLTGESGTGKSFTASFIHRLSNRSKGPFCVLDMGSIHESLADSTLFGCKKGSFTDALDNDGLIIQADQGTLFFDEITNAPFTVQVKLLRFLETGLIRSIGSSYENKINTHVICATNANIHELIKQNLFRSDLYNRICTFKIHLEPLRKHKEDIELLVLAYLNRHSFSITQSALSLLKNYDWPGNIRQLEQYLSRATATCSNKLVDSSDLVFDYHAQENKFNYFSL